jgi:arabinogalactan endo-1,4-beta-galactosidase
MPLSSGTQLRRKLRAPPLIRSALLGALTVVVGCSSGGSDTPGTVTGGFSNSTGGSSAPSGGTSGSGSTGGGRFGEGGAIGSGGNRAGSGGNDTNGTGKAGSGGTAASGPGGSGGASATGGTSNGGFGNGGFGNGGLGNGGLGNGGGTTSGGETGGTSESGGSASGGAASGGTASGGGMSGGAGSGSGSLDFSYWIGADVSFEGTQPEATRANLLSVMKSKGFNAVRLRTFVDPTAADGYNKSGACDLANTIAFGKQIKAAGMGLLVDFHYSDNWADPGKQCVPIKWQAYTTVAQLAAAVHDYTKDAITQLIAGGARPDMVQIGNETTPGMLIHRCNSSGSPTGTNPVSGSTSNWTTLGPLLKAGVDGVKEVDPKILVSFHIAKGGDHTDGKSALSTSVTWLTNALKYTPVDAFGESCYQTYQGDASSASKSKAIWQTVEGGLASRFPNVKIFAAEYGGAPRELNDVVYDLPNQQGLGTFYWEPTVSGDWNPGVTLFGRSGSTYTKKSDASVYDQMKTAYAARL